MQLKTRRTAILIAALVLIVGISVIIYKVSSPQGEDLADPAVANTNQAEEGEPQVEEAAVEYVFQANDPRNTLKGPHTEVADCAPCSDGKQVGGLFEGSSVQFNDVEIPEAGQYIVTVYYISGDPRSSLFRLTELAKRKNMICRKSAKTTGSRSEPMSSLLNWQRAKIRCCFPTATGIPRILTKLYCASAFGE